MQAKLTIHDRRNTRSLYSATAETEADIRRLVSEAQTWMRHNGLPSIVVTMAWPSGAVSSIVITRRRH